MLKPSPALLTAIGGAAIDHAAIGKAAIGKAAVGLVAVGLACACSAPAPAPPQPSATAPSTTPAAPAPATPATSATSATSLDAARARDAPAPVPQAASAAAAGPSASTAISAEQAEAILFLRASDVPPAAATCPRDDREGRIRCLLGLRFEGDPAAAAAAVELFSLGGDVAGIEPEQVMEGGFRGQIHLVPEPPVGPHRRHLLWTLAASRDFAWFFQGIERAASGPVRYRHRDIAYRFFRSVKRTTPSAYALGWTIAYNVSGSLHSGEAAVRETLFHEIFHLNDAAHRDWSARALGSIFDAIVKKCGTRVACLKPYAPGDTMVRGGTYYAFQPDNGEAVHEYAAELASRYYREHRAILRKEAFKESPKESPRESPREPAERPFKCGPEENGRAWDAIRREFFGGTDLIPDCAR